MNEPCRQHFVLPLEFQVVFALQLASSFLELVSMQWHDKHWSKDDVKSLIWPTADDGTDAIQGLPICLFPLVATVL